MFTSIISPDFVEHTELQAGKLADTIQSFRRELLTSLVYVDFPQQTGEILLFARGQLVNVYRAADPVERLDPSVWLSGLPEANPQAGLRSLALTPQDIRIYKILIEQQGDQRGVETGGLSLKKRLEEWAVHPVPALAQVRWPKAEALLLFPGQGALPYYSLFITAEHLLHSAGGVNQMLAWKEAAISTHLFSSEPCTPAWAEYLLQNAFSALVVRLFGKFEKLVGRITLNQIVRDVNFRATAHDWNLSVSANSVNDQSIFSSPTAAGEMYSSLLEVIFRHYGSVLGSAMLEMLLREAIFRLPALTRQVVSQYLPVTNLG